MYICIVINQKYYHMKSLFVVIFSLLVNLVVGQGVSYSTFNSQLLNKKVLIEINKLRRNRGIDTLVTSNSVYQLFSNPNCIEVSLSGRFYHPPNQERYNNLSIRSKIISEAKNIYGGESVMLQNGLPKMSLYENAFKSNVDYSSYDELAYRIVIAWENSEGHKRVQNMEFDSSNLPGVFACHSVMNQDGTIFVFVDYVKIFRVE